MAALTLASCTQTVEGPYPVETFKTPKGSKVSVYLISHGSIAISTKDYSIQIDPVMAYKGGTLDYSCFPKADAIFISHEHGDHLDPAAIEALSKEGTLIYANAASIDKLGKGEAMANGESVKLTNKISVQAVPAYNIGKAFHPQGNGNGYVVDIEGLRIYVSGDTEDIEELSDLKDIDIAFLSANLPFTMTVDQCVNAAKIINPAVLFPYHLGETDMNEIKDKLEGSGIDVRLNEVLR